MAIHDIGDEVALECTFRAEDGTPVSPATVICTVRPPSGPNATPEVTPTDDGGFRALYQPTTAGIYSYSFDGTGTNLAAEEGHFSVRQRRVIR